MRVNEVFSRVEDTEVICLHLQYLGLYISLWLCVGIAVGFIISKMS